MQMKTDKEYLFESMPVGKAIIALAVPTVISQLITVFYNMADTFFIGRLNDPRQVAAATVAMPIFMLLTAFANLFGIGGASFISRSLGVGDRKRAKHCASFCILTGSFIALLYGIVINISRSVIFPILGVNHDTWSFCQSYVFWTICIGALPTVLNAELAHLIRSEGYSSQAGFGVAFGGILNIFLDPIFIFLFKMDITGAAVATLLSNIIATCYFLLFIYKIRDKSVITPSLKMYSTKDNIPKEVITVGLPSSIMALMSTISNTVLNNMVASYSTEAIAGMGIAKKIDSMAFAIAQGMTQGTLPLVGYNFSSGNHKRMIEVLKTLMIYSVYVAGIGTLLLYFGAKPITQCFIGNRETVEYGKQFLKIIALACTTTMLNFYVITVFQATGKKLQPMILSVLRKGSLDVPLMFLFNFFIGIKGIAWATPLADLMAFMIAITFFIPYVRSIKNPVV